MLLEMRERVPDHSWLSRTRARLPHWARKSTRRCLTRVLPLIAEAGLVKGERIGGGCLDHGPGTTRRCATSCGGTRARVTGGRRQALGPGERRIETPTAEDLAQSWTASARARTRARACQAWVSRSDPEAKIFAKMKKDLATHLAYKPEHAVDLGTPARWWRRSCTRLDEGDTTTLPGTLATGRLGKPRVSRWLRGADGRRSRPNV